MKISVAQIQSSKGDIQKNIDIHMKWIRLAGKAKVDVIMFPELSLTGYEPTLAKDLALHVNDKSLDDFQSLSNQYNITIGLGAPVLSEWGIHIGIIFFQPFKSRLIYAKRKLHADEIPYFVAGEEALLLGIKGIKIAPAICYESLHIEHALEAINLGANLYLTSVAKSQNGLEKAFQHYPTVAKEGSMPVLMSNSIGYCDDFLSTGQSAVWNSQGVLVEKLSKDKEGILIFDMESETALKIE